LLNNLSQFRRELVVKTKSESGTEPFLNAGTRDPFPTRAREDSFRVVFNASKIFGRKTAQLSETLRESVYSGSASENRLHNTAG
jgi:hypothetical protein